MDSYSRKYKVAATLIEQGYLIHCTNDDFKEFSPNFIKGGFRAREGYGFYFSDMPYKSIEYGDNIKIIRKSDFNFLEAKDKVDMSMFQPSEETIRNLNFARNQLDSARNVRDYDYFSNLVDELENELKGYDETLMYYVRKALSETSEQTYGALEYHIMNPKAMTPKLARVYVKNGYDGYHYDGIYTVFNFDKLNKNVISLTDEDIEQLLATNETKTKGRTIIISEEQARYIEDGLKNGFNSVNEAMGVSDEVTNLSNEIFATIEQKINQTEWKKDRETGLDTKSLSFYLDNPIIKSVLVTLYSYSPNVETYNHFLKYYGDNGLLKNYCMGNTIVIAKPYPSRNNENEINYFRKDLMSTINHELKHALQNYKGGRKTNKLYQMSVNNLLFNNYFNDNNQTEMTIRYYINYLYYFFSKNEMDANLQQIYQEINDNDGNLFNSKRFQDYQEGIKEYRTIMRTYRKNPQLVNKIVKEELKTEKETITIFTQIMKSIKYFNRHLNRIIGRYAQDTGNKPIVNLSQV